MAHARWSDIIRFAIAGSAAVGVYYLFYYFRVETLGSVFAFITLTSICLLEYYIPGLIKRKIKNKQLEKFQAKQQQDPYEIRSKKQKRLDNIANLPSDSIICPKCGGIVKKGNKYCWGCGKDFEDFFSRK